MISPSWSINDWRLLARMMDEGFCWIYYLILNFELASVCPTIENVCQVLYCLIGSDVL